MTTANDGSELTWAEKLHAVGALDGLMVRCISPMRRSKCMWLMPPLGSKWKIKIHGTEMYLIPAKHNGLSDTKINHLDSFSSCFQIVEDGDAPPKAAR